ncbi:MAG: hypothetical protein J5772_01095 [Clostridia bacterium]|nr:hypothetical protein [Clostridia bacterium]
MFEERFRGLCESAAADAAALGTAFVSDRKFAEFTMLLRYIKLELVFKRNSLGQVNNVLYCRIYPNKNTEVFYFLPEIFVELDIPEFRSTFFAQIENEQRLEACFAALWGIIKQYLPEIEEAAAAGRLPWEREVGPDDYLERRLIFPEFPAISREPFVISDYTKGPVNRALLAGDTQKAIKLIEKLRAKGKTLEYQNRLSDHLKARGGDFLPMPDECNAVIKEEKADKKALPVAFGTVLIVFAALSALFLIAKLIFDRIFFAGTETYFAAPWYACFLLAATPAIFGAVLLRKKLIKLLCPKRAKAMIERDIVKNGKLTDKLAGLGFAAAAGFAIGVFIMITLPSARVYQDRIDTAGDENVFRRETYMFDEIEEICHISSRYNVYGDRIRRSSYVLVMKDGRLLDLDGTAPSDAAVEEKLMPLLEKYSLPVRELDSDRDLP